MPRKAGILLDVPYIPVKTRLPGSKRFHPSFELTTCRHRKYYYYEIRTTGRRDLLYLSSAIWSITYNHVHPLPTLFHHPALQPQLTQEVHRMVMWHLDAHDGTAAVITDKLDLQLPTVHVVKVGVKAGRCVQYEIGIAGAGRSIRGSCYLFHSRHEHSLGI